MNELIFKKKNKVVRTIFDVSKCVLLSFALGLVLSLVFGYKYLNIISGSMSPTMPVNTVVVIKKIPFNNIVVGDVVTYKVGATNVTHRVIAIDKENKLLTTKGDNSNTEDGQKISEKMVQGVVIAKFVGLGAVVNFLTDQFIFVVVIIGIILGIFLYAFY